MEGRDHHNASSTEHQAPGTHAGALRLAAN
jgi:hypothetical protein